MMRAASASSVILCTVLGLTAGCATTDDNRLRNLQAENETLRRELEDLKTELRERGPEGDFTSIDSFTVGLAAAERDFDAAAFEKLLSESLTASAQDRDARVFRVTDEREVNKIRGMLAQQYLAAEQIPIQITNLSFKLQDTDNAFKIGEQVVPRDDLEITRAAPGSALSARHAGPVPAVLRRDTAGQYSIAYEELGGGSGAIQISTDDRDILNSDERPHAERQGDISFNWSLNLDQIQVYEIEGFRGDVGLFLANMRYSGVQSSIGQYQTLRDSVFLFGYGSYRTRVVQQIRTPVHISSVELLPLDDATFRALDGRMDEREILERAGATTRWQPAEFADFASGEKIWERPASVGFPFLSRQMSETKGQVFYIKYSSEGPFFLGDFKRRERENRR